MTDTFYRAFEDQYRGSREVIKGRLAAYRPFVEPLLAAYPVAEAVDLGCGRGEWLELLASLGFRPTGVDLDQGMLDACRELGLDVEQGDAIAYLAALPDQSQIIVSAFHVVEHIAFDTLRTLVAEALRVLKPGGILILETPNPENIVVATRNFYLDPTHQRPLPAGLLAFVVQHAGFSRVKTLGLQESCELIGKQDLSLRDVLAGPSPDYAVVAQKNADDEVLALASEAFNREYGLSLDDLLIRWEDRFVRLESKSQQALTTARQAEASARQAESRAEQAEAASSERLAQLQAVYASSSWKITRPLRGIKRVFSGDFSVVTRLVAAAKFRVKGGLKPLVSAGVIQIIRRPRLRAHLSRLASHFPSLRRRLVRIALNLGSPGPASASPAAVPPRLQAISPRARRIHQDLRTAIENCNRGNA